MAIRIAIVGAGNCAKSLVEGIAFYSTDPAQEAGLMRPHVGPYHVADIEVVAAFDIDKRKVGKVLRDALNAEPNRTLQLSEIPLIDVVVDRGPTLDSVIPELRSYYIFESDAEPVDVSAKLRAVGAEIVVNYLPTGSDMAARAYAEAALDAGCSFVNCMPAPLAKDWELRQRFTSAGLVILGDDIKSQCGATIVNRILLSLFRFRGVRTTSSTQLNVGGNADHFNLQFRAHEKEASKEAALLSVTKDMDVAPQARMTYLEGNYDHKRAVITIRGEVFGRAPVSIELVLDDEDSPNSGGVVVDAIRATRILVETGNAWRAVEICAGLMKSPVQQAGEAEANNRFDRVIDDCLKARA